MRAVINIPNYTSKDIPILVSTMLPMAVLLNYFLYGQRYFNSIAMFVPATLLTFAICAIAYLTYGFVAFSLRNRYPDDRQSFKRLGICISIFFLMSAVYISLVLICYDNFHFFNYQYNENDFTTCYLAFIVVNVFLTFLNEGVYRFEKYRNTIKETAQLKKEYMHSQLLGLKSQMNPHFLFNSLNTLSSLLQEDADKADHFLDHMSKVYRYLLRNNEEQLVPVDTELSFIKSYFYLLKARYADGLQLNLEVDEQCLQHAIPPMTLQMLLENILNQNSLSRSKPLNIVIASQGEWLIIKNNIQHRMNCPDDCCEAIENISNKYRLLCQQEIIIDEDDKEKQVRLPLITNIELSMA